MLNVVYNNVKRVDEDTRKYLVSVMHLFLNKYTNQNNTENSSN